MLGDQGKFEKNSLITRLPNENIEVLAEINSRYD